MKYRKLLLALALGCAALGFAGNACAAEPAVTPETVTRGLSSKTFPPLPAFVQAQAEDLFLKKDYEGCAALLTKEIASQPEHLGLYFVRGMAYSQMEKWETALADWREIVRQLPDSPAAHYYLADTFAMLKRYEEALTEADEVERLADASEPSQKVLADVVRRDVFVIRGAGEVDKRNWEAALADADRALTLFPDDGTAYMIRQAVYRKTGNDEKLVESTHCAMGAMSAGKGFAKSAGWWYLIGKACERAAFWYSRAIEDEPDDIELYSRRGTAYGLDGRYEEAIADFSKVCEKTRSAETLNDRGETYRMAKRYDLAREDLEEAYRLDPGYTPLLDSLGMLEYDTGHYEKAISYFNQCLDKKTYSRTYEYRGKAYAALGKQKEAARDEKLAAKEKKKEIEKDKAFFKKLVETLSTFHA